MWAALGHHGTMEGNPPQWHWNSIKVFSPLWISWRRFSWGEPGLVFCRDGQRMEESPAPWSSPQQMWKGREDLQCWRINSVLCTSAETQPGPWGQSAGCAAGAVPASQSPWQCPITAEQVPPVHAEEDLPLCLWSASADGDGLAGFGSWWPTCQQEAFGTGLLLQEPGRMKDWLLFNKTYLCNKPC